VFERRLPLLSRLSKVAHRERFHQGREGQRVERQAALTNRNGVYDKVRLSSTPIGITGTRTEVTHVEAPLFHEVLNADWHHGDDDARASGVAFGLLCVLNADWHHGDEDRPRRSLA